MSHLKPHGDHDRYHSPAVEPSEASILRRMAGLHARIVRGQVWCRTCGRTQKVDSAECLRSGWPKCCGYTMTIDSPEESIL